MVYSWFHRWVLSNTGYRLVVSERRAPRLHVGKGTTLVCDTGGGLISSPPNALIASARQPLSDRCTGNFRLYIRIALTVHTRGTRTAGTIHRNICCLERRIEIFRHSSMTFILHHSPSASINKGEWDCLRLLNTAWALDAHSIHCDAVSVAGANNLQYVI